MQISSVTTTQLISPLAKTTNSPSSANVSSSSSSDEAVINFSPDSFSSLVSEAGQMPEVRNDVVDSFKSRIASGQYPTQATIAGLTNILGGSILQQANAQD